MKYTYFTLVLATPEHQVGYKLIYVKVCVVFVQKLWVSKTDPQTPLLSPSDLGQQRGVMFFGLPQI